MVEERRLVDDAILVVEDDRDVSGMLRTFLETEGYAVVVADDAVQARERFTQLHPRVAVLDVHLPGGSGLDLTRAIKASGRATGVIIMTAGLATEREARDAGADAFLLKTAPLRQLSHAVRRLGARPALV
jgi:DNA-binding response OmpR family regulator